MTEIEKDNWNNFDGITVDKYIINVIGFPSNDPCGTQTIAGPFSTEFTMPYLNRQQL